MGARHCEVWEPLTDFPICLGITEANNLNLALVHKSQGESLSTSASLNNLADPTTSEQSLKATVAILKW